MASINGIKIKNLKFFKDHEGMSIAQGDIWYKGRKLGFWSQDYSGCICDNFDFNEKVLEEEVEKYRASDRVEDKYRKVTSVESLLADLVELSEREKAYKKGTKMAAKYPTYVMATDGFRVKGYYTLDTDKERIKGEAYHKKFLKGCKDAFFKDWNGECTIYTSLKDFDISV